MPTRSHLLTWKHPAAAEDPDEEHCAFQCRCIQNTHIFVPLVLDTIVTGGCEQFPSPSFVPLSSNSQSPSFSSKWHRWQGDNSHPLCSQSILPLPRPALPVSLKWQPCYSAASPVPKQPSLPPVPGLPQTCHIQSRKPYHQNMCSGAELSAQSIYLVLIMQEINSVHQCMLVISISLIKAFVSIKTLVKMFL